jgi:uracil-DNA glycosylase
MNTYKNLADIKLSWTNLIIDYHTKNNNYFDNIEKLLQTKFYPKRENIFECFKYFDIEQTKCVLLGQDPYINEENLNGYIIPQAMGLSFSVNKNIKIPPSLRNIFMELKSNLNIPIPISGDLTNWAKNNVLLLNAGLTVKQKESGSHIKVWEPFTDYIIKNISDKCNNIVFILLGNYAKSKVKYIDTKKHCIIQCVHPSPLSANKGFFGSNIFSKTNEYLLQNNIQEIDWSI